MKSPVGSRQRDRRLVFGLFLAATFGMMIVLSLPLARFIPLPSRVPGLLGFPWFFDPLRPFPPPLGADRPPEAVAQVDADTAPLLAPILPPVVGGPGPGAIPETVSVEERGPRVLVCEALGTSERGHDRKGRPKTGPSGKKRVAVSRLRRCERLSVRGTLQRTEGPAWTMPRGHDHARPAMASHGQKHSNNGHHQPKKPQKKPHKPKKK